MKAAIQILAQVAGDTLAEAINAAPALTPILLAWLVRQAGAMRKSLRRIEREWFSEGGKEE